MGFIYAIQNLTNDKLYIGKTERTIELRWKGHLSELRQNTKRQCHFLNNSIRKHGIENFKIYEIDSVPDEQLNEYEEFYINYFNSLSPNGYNLTKGGEGCKPSDETKIKMSIWQKGKPKSDNHREKMRDYAKNRPESHNKKLSEANKNRKVSDETKFKMSEVRRKLTDKDIENINELLKTKTQVEIAKMYNISTRHISRINRGWTPKQITSNCITDV